MNCPICGRNLNGQFTNDPILTTPSLSTDEFKGFTNLVRQHIEELQVERHQQEIDNGVLPLTIFSPINSSGFFQNIKQYITELRDSTEKILAITGMTLAEFLSTDEDGNPMTSKIDWTDSNLEEIKYQCKAIHIEDLRHFIQFGKWEEDWSGSYSISKSNEQSSTSYLHVEGLFESSFSAKKTWNFEASYLHNHNIFELIFPPIGVFAHTLVSLTFSNANLNIYMLTEGRKYLRQQAEVDLGLYIAPTISFFHTMLVDEFKKITANSSITLTLAAGTFCQITFTDSTIWSAIVGGTWSLSAYNGKTISEIRIIKTGLACIFAAGGDFKEEVNNSTVIGSISLDKLTK